MGKMDKNQRQNRIKCERGCYKRRGRGKLEREAQTERQEEERVVRERERE